MPEYTWYVRVRVFKCLCSQRITLVYESAVDAWISLVRERVLAQVFVLSNRKLLVYNVGCR